MPTKIVTNPDGSTTELFQKPYDPRYEPEPPWQPINHFPARSTGVSPDYTSSNTNSPTSTNQSTQRKGSWFRAAAISTALLGATLTLPYAILVGLRSRAGVRDGDFPYSVSATRHPSPGIQSSQVLRQKNGCSFTDPQFTVENGTTVYLYPDHDGRLIFTQGKDTPGLRATREYEIKEGEILSFGFNGISRKPVSIGPGTLRVRCAGTTDEMVERNPALELVIGFNRAPIIDNE